MNFLLELLHRLGLTTKFLSYKKHTGRRGNFVQISLQFLQDFIKCFLKLNQIPSFYLWFGPQGSKMGKIPFRQPKGCSNLFLTVIKNSKILTFYKHSYIAYALLQSSYLSRSIKVDEEILFKFISNFFRISYIFSKTLSNSTVLPLVLCPRVVKWTFYKHSYIA